MERFCKLGLGCFQRRSFWRSDFFMTTGKVIGHYSFKQKQMFPSKWWWFGWLESSKHQQFKLFKLRGAIVQYPGLTGIRGGKEPASQCMEPKWGPVFWQIWRIKWLEGQPSKKEVDRWVLCKECMFLHIFTIENFMDPFKLFKSYVLAEKKQWFHHF